MTAVKKGRIKVKRIISLLLALTMIVACLPLQSFATENTTEFMGGDGTEENPYLISNKRHLDNIRLYTDAHFLLVTDITFTESDGAWEPIDFFDGVIDGAGHTISGLRIETITLIKSKEYGAGFILENYGTIQNLHLRGGLFALSGFSASSGKILNAGVFAAINNGNLKNCTSDTVVNVVGTGGYDTSGRVRVGGFVGSSGENCEIDHCINFGAVTAVFDYPHGIYMLELMCGGLVGVAYGTAITNCGNLSPVYAKTKDSLYAGGIVGNANYLTTIDSCYNTGDIYARAYKYEETGPLRNYVDVYCGGIAGYAYVSNSYNTGKVEGSARGQYDRLRSFGISIGECTNCYNVGQVSGEVDGKNSTLKIGAVSEKGENGYYLEGVVTGPCEGVSCTQDQLQKEATFAGFDFENVWGFDAFDDTYAYPKLKWQIAPISSVSILSKPEAPIVVTEGLEPELGNIIVHVEREDGQTKNVPLNINMLPDLDIHALGQQVIPVVYNGIQSEDTITIHVVDKQVTKIELVTLPDKLDYFKDQEALDLSGGQVKITYNNNTEEIRSLAEFQVTGFCSSSIGEQTLTVEYQGKTTQFNVTVYEIASIRMAEAINKWLYYLNEEELSVEGGKVKLQYTNGKSDIIDLQRSMVSGFDNTVLGRQILTVNYQGYETRFEVWVYGISSIDIHTKPSKMQYVQGQPLQLDGGKLYVYYTQGKSTDVIPLDQATVSYDPDRAGVVPVTISYRGFETTLNITVRSKIVDSVKDFVEPQKLSYYQGENLDLTGGSLCVTYVSEDGYSETIPLTESMISGYDKDAVGYQTLTVSYYDFSQTFVVRVIEKKISSIEVVTLPQKLIYGYQNQLDVTGGTICATYNSGETQMVALTQEMVSGFDSTVAGIQSLTVTYGGKTCTYEVTVITESFSVIFQDWDGSQITKESYYYSDEVVVPADPARAADNACTYTFAGWDKEIVVCTGDATYTATYASEYIDYTVTFQYEDGTVIAQYTLHYGDVVTIPEAPAVPEVFGSEYAFKGWDKEVTACAGDAVYTAVFGLLYPTGDFTKDHGVTNEDVIYLLWHTMFPETYPVDTQADFNNDNLVTNEDVIYLLWHTMFPESYPLTGKKERIG